VGRGTVDLGWRGRARAAGHGRSVDRGTGEKRKNDWLDGDWIDLARWHFSVITSKQHVLTRKRFAR
jgi:hypothetical protein